MDQEISQFAFSSCSTMDLSAPFNSPFLRIHVIYSYTVGGVYSPSMLHKPRMPKLKHGIFYLICRLFQKCRYAHMNAYITKNEGEGKHCCYQEEQTGRKSGWKKCRCPYIYIPSVPHPTITAFSLLAGVTRDRITITKDT